MSDEPKKTFSSRHGYSAPDRQIIVREDAPRVLREAVLQIAVAAGVGPSTLRAMACKLLRVLPDPNNWSEYPNVWYEVQELILGCPWYRVYDIIEAVAAHLAAYDPAQVTSFEGSVNEAFREHGIGWQLTAGAVQTRGEEAFELTVSSADAALSDAGLPTARQEIHEALHDLSRRPEPDLTGRRNPEAPS